MTMKTKTIILLMALATAGALTVAVFVDQARSRVPKIKKVERIPLDEIEVRVDELKESVAANQKHLAETFDNLGITLEWQQRITEWSVLEAEGKELVRQLDATEAGEEKDIIIEMIYQKAEEMKANKKRRVELAGLLAGVVNYSQSARTD